VNSSLPVADEPKPAATKGRSLLRRIGLVLGTVAGACLVFVLGLSIWNLALVHWQQAHINLPGALYSVEGRQMHLYCAGAGSPTVVIETGVGSTSLGWYLVQERLSSLTRVCTYDRSGLGWSEPRDGPQDSETIARRLHILLNDAGVPRPLLLVGHSGGGLYIREYTREFPDEVAGLVFVDSSSPRQMDELPGFRAGYEDDMRHATRDLWIDRMRVWSGWERLMGRCKGRPDKGFENYADLYDAKECRPEYVDADFPGYRDFEAAAEQAGRLTSVGNKPVLVLSKDSHRSGMDERAAAEAPFWDREQEELKSLSPQSWRIIARSSGHTIFKERADLVVAQLTLLINYLRGGTAPPFGMTTTQ
jgi:pimeloyl-ACP methyl ester carboxylesterase